MRASGTCVDSNIVNMPYASAEYSGQPADWHWDGISTATGGGGGAKVRGPGAGILPEIGPSLVPMPVSARRVRRNSYAGTTNAKEQYCNRKEDRFPIRDKFPQDRLPAEDRSRINREHDAGDFGAQFDLARISMRIRHPPHPSVLNCCRTNQQNASSQTITEVFATVGCNEPEPSAIDTYSRVHDDPTTNSHKLTGNEVTPAPGRTSRERPLRYSRRTARDQALAGNAVTLAGAIHYVELDVNNLDRCSSEPWERAGQVQTI